MRALLVVFVALAAACDGEILGPFTPIGSSGAGAGPGIGNTGAGGGSMVPHVDPASPLPRFTCVDPATRGTGDKVLPRLSRDEFVATLRAVFSDETLSAVTALGQFPNDVIESSVADFRPLHAFEHVDASVNVALQLASAVVGTRARLDRVAPACVGTQFAANNVQDTCLRQFIAQLGARVYRRPLTAAQVQALVDVHKASELAMLSQADRLEAVIARMLQAPELQFHWVEREGTVAGARQAVDAFTVANRIAYRATGAPPDAELLAAATSGALATTAQREAQAKRLFESAAGHERVRGLFTHWLRLWKGSPPTLKAATRAGLAVQASALPGLRQAANDELLKFAETIIYERAGSFAELLESPLAFPTSPELAQLMKMSPGAAQAGDGRAGLLMRPAMLMSGVDRESPILRGVALRTRVLCDDVPPPPANLDGDIMAARNAVDATQVTARMWAEQVTGAGSCKGCHRSLNSLGFSLSGFGPLGELRTEEKTYDAAGMVVRTFAVDESATALDISSPLESVTGHAELPALFSQAAKAKACFTKFAFRVSHSRLEDPAADACALADVEASVRAGEPLLTALARTVAAEDVLWAPAP